MNKIITFVFSLLTICFLANSPVAFPQNNCLPPSAVTATNITQTSATIAWATSGINGLYNIQYNAAGSNIWSQISSVQNPYNVTGLTCNTVYIFQVQTICVSPNGTTTLSPWSSPFTLVTASCQNSCPAPFNLSATNVSQTGAVLSWNANATIPFSFNLRYRVAGNNNWISISNATSPYQLGNLTCGTVYEWQVQTACFNSSTGNPTLSPWSTSNNFTTLACQNNCLPPAGLTVTNISQTGVVLVWSSIATNQTGYNIRYRNSTTTAWTTVNNVSSPYQLGGLTCGTTYEWQVQSICASSPGTIVLSPWSSSFTFTTLPCQNNCPAPTGLNASNVTQTTATLSWQTISATGLYNIQYLPNNSNVWVQVNGVSSPYLLTGLVCNTIYIFQVQAICISPNGTTTLSPWSAPHTFITQACQNNCPAPTGLTTTNISLNSATLNWGVVSGASAYSIRYRAVGTLAAWMYVTSATNSVSVNALNCAIAYEWQVKAICSPVSNTNANPFSAIAVFTTMPCSTNCPAPLALTVGNVTATSATLAWTTTGAPMYRVRYRVVGTSAWQFQNSIPTTTIIGGLTPLSVYECQVQSICSPNSNTLANPWSSPVIFTTLQLPNSACLAPVNLAATAVNQGTAVLTWNVVAGASAYNVRYKPMNSTLPYVSVTSTGNVLTITGLNPSTGYEWQVQAVCTGTNGVVITSPWSVTNVFTTPMMIVVYPNPVDQQMNVSYEPEAPSVINYELRDVFGKVVYTAQSQASTGSNAFRISTGSLHPGWYSLTVIGTNTSSTTRVLIQR